MTVDASSTDDPVVRAETEPLAAETAVAASEAVLAQRFGSSITLVDAEDLGGSGPATVIRARVASSSFALPRTLVIKHYPGTTPATGSDPFAREATSYQLFTALSPEDRVCPELLAHSAEHRLLVIEDLGRAPTLQDTLAGGDSRAAETALLSWARSLGKMHFSTAGREDDFNALLRRLSSRSRSDEDVRSGAGEGSPADGAEEPSPATAAAEVPALLSDRLGVSTPDRVRDAVLAAGEHVGSPAYRAFSPVDLWPDNNLMTSDGVRFLDFERGRVRSAFVDIAHFRVPFAFSPRPLALPAGMSEAMIAAWRAEVAELWPALADDDTLSTSLLDAQLVLVWWSTWCDLPGLADVRETGAVGRAAALVTWWRDLAEYADRGGRVEVATHAAAVADALERRFGPGVQLALYPAFR